jgi:hypothetical protein
MCRMHVEYANIRWGTRMRTDIVCEAGELSRLGALFHDRAARFCLHTLSALVADSCRIASCGSFSRSVVDLDESRTLGGRRASFAVSPVVVPRR